MTVFSSFFNKFKKTPIERIVSEVNKSSKDYFTVILSPNHIDKSIECDEIFVNSEYEDFDTRNDAAYSLMIKLNELGFYSSVDSSVIKDKELMSYSLLTVMVEKDAIIK